MKPITTIIAFTSLLLFNYCSDDSPTSSTTKTYKYTGYDSSWNKIITGYLWIKSVDSISVKGSWDFKLVSNEENLGPQIGKGVFEGTTDMRGSMSLNLNPKWVDNNVILDGNTFLPYKFEGAWHYIGYAGEINWGRFEATQAH
jgi:hypothetical protein